MRNVARDPTPDTPAAQMSGSPGGEVTLRMRVPGDLLLHYRQLERAHRLNLPGICFIPFLWVSFWGTWAPTLGVSDKWEAIYRRDRYRCTSPVCHQRNVTLHHVEYRAGGDEVRMRLGRGRNKDGTALAPDVSCDMNPSGDQEWAFEFRTNRQEGCPIEAAWAPVPG